MRHRISCHGSQVGWLHIRVHLYLDKIICFPFHFEKLSDLQGHSIKFNLANIYWVSTWKVKLIFLVASFPCVVINFNPANDTKHLWRGSYHPESFALHDFLEQSTTTLSQTLQNWWNPDKEWSLPGVRPQTSGLVLAPWGPDLWPQVKSCHCFSVVIYKK